MRGRSVNFIVATTQDMGIGFKGNLPWRLKSELAYFSKMTKATQDPSKKNVVIVGRKTWESIPEKNRPLKDRINIVLSSKQIDLGPKSEDVFLCCSLKEAMEVVNSSPLEPVIESTWIIGGAAVYKAALDEGLCDKIYWTLILNSFECDTFMPKWGPNFVECKEPDVPEAIQEENGIKFKYSVLKHVEEC